MKKCTKMLLLACLMVTLVASALPAGVLAADSQGDWMTPFDEPVTITIANELHDNAVFPEGDDIENNIWIRAFEEKFNVIVETEWISDDWSNYQTKMNLAIASQSLPDIFYVSASQFKQLQEANAIMDISDIYNQYASDNLREVMDSQQDIMETVLVDGKMYGLPHLHYGYLDKPNYIWLRKDWMEDGGHSAPETLDELEAILTNFVEVYGGYGMAVDQTLDYLLTMSPSFGAYHDIWVEAEDGTIQYSSIQPEMKEALATFARWYEEGLIDPEFATKDYNAMMQGVSDGKTGSQLFPQWWGYAIGPDVIRNNGENAYFEPYRLPSANGVQVSHPVKFPNDRYTVVNANCENPEALMKLTSYFNYIINDALLLGDINAEEMDAYTGNNIMHVTGPFYFMDPRGELTQYIEVQEALKNDGAIDFTNPNSLVKYEGCLKFLKDGDPDGIGFVLQVGADRCGYGLGKEDLETDNYVRSKLWGATPDVLLEYGSTLTDLLKEGFTKIVIGAEPIDYFDTLVENWKTAGGQDATDAVNEMYGSK